MDKFYFDYASTSPADPKVIRAMEPYLFETFGNASSPHSFGRSAKKALEDSRETVARTLGAKPEEIVFTSGGTESNNHALIGMARSLSSRGRHILVSRIEHHSVLRPIEFLQKEGYSVNYLPVDRQGIVDPKQVADAITDQTTLVAVMHASNEIGSIQDVKAIGRICGERNICFHVDAVQTAGHLPVKVAEIGCSTLAVSAHKFYGPKGVGALYIRKGTSVANFLLGGDQERGLRASTQNVAGAVGLAQALELCLSSMSEESSTQTELRDRLIKEISTGIPGVHVNGHPTQRLPNNAHFSFEGVDGEALLMSLDMAGIAASMGSACTSGAMKASHVLTAIGLSEKLAFGSLRLSLGRWTTAQHIELLLEQLPKIVARLRAAG